MIKRLFSIALVLLLSDQISAQLTVWVADWPDTAGKPVYLAGNINAWNPETEGFQLEEKDSGLWLTISQVPTDGIAFKFTQGSWATVELQADGSDRPNRIYPKVDGDTIRCTIEKWSDGAPKKLPPLNANIQYHSIHVPYLAADRTIRVYVPPAYGQDTISYPVVYLTDAQNLFDVATSYAGEWEIDEVLDERSKLGLPTAIVVGIDHAGDARFNEYSPWAHPEYGGGLGDNFVKWLIDSVKSTIDETYRTKSKREYTFIGGSSLGGLISSYAVVEYNDVIGGAFIFSPSYWISAESFDHIMEKPITKPTKIYMTCGGMEGMQMLNDIMVVYGLLNEIKSPGKVIRLNIESDQQHNEDFWRREWPIAIDWMLEDC